MQDQRDALWRAQNGAGAVGRVLVGLGVLLGLNRELWLIEEGREPERVPADAFGLTFGGITIAGRPFAALGGIEGADRDSGEPCVSFVHDGREVLIAPATPPSDPTAVLAEVGRLIANDWYDDDHVYLSDLNGPVGDRTSDQVGVRRPAAAATENPDLSTLIPDDELVIRGEAMRLGDITWIERESDGDGNRYAHIVLRDGRYRRIAFGDLGR